MYAVIKAGGHQYRVSQGDTLTVDYQPGKKEGEKLTFDHVLMIGGEKMVVGDPLVKGATVEAVVKKQARAPKILVFKFKRRKQYKRTRGHKQPITEIEITGIKN